MAVLTLTNRRFNTRGRFFEVSGNLAAVADGDTVACPGLSKVVGAQVEPTGTTAPTAPVAATPLTYPQVGSISGRTITFEQGDGKPAQLIAWGYR